MINQLSNSTAPRTLLPGAQQFSVYRFNTLTGPVYFYHPLTEIDMSAFEQFNLTEGDYSFFNGELSFVGHAGLFPY